jgi:hypothetical protein
VIIDIEGSAGVVTKKAETPAEVSRLRKEAAVLRDAPHPGVVELIEQEDSGVLRLRKIDGGSLEGWFRDGPGRWTSTDIMALGAEVATTVADLHDLGIIHGQVTARHILITRNRRPILCSPGHPAAGPEDDVAALGRLLGELQSGALASDRPGPTGALDRAIASATRPDPRRRPTARSLARTLALAPAESNPPRRFGSTRGRGLDVAAMGAAGVVALLLAGALWLRPASLGRTRTVFAGSAGRFQVSEPDDPVVAGRWTCGTPLPAVLRPTTGEVWVWDGWPRGRQSLIGRLASRVAGATSLRVVAASPSCDTLVITRRAGPPVAIDPSPRRGASD